MSRTWTLAVPSRKRTHLMERLRALLPTARICVDVREEADYLAAGVPAELLWLHPPMTGLAQIREWMVQNNDTDALVMCDDDLSAVRCLVGRRVRTIVDPSALLRILEGSLMAAWDLDLSVFCYSRNPDPRHFHACHAFSLAAPCYAVFGVIGKKLHFDTTVDAAGRGDLKFTMEVLLRERVLLQDRRFYWDFGPVFAGVGGLQGVRTGEGEKAGLDALQKHWGKYLEIKVLSNGHTGASVAVPRRQDDATQ